MGTSSSYSGPTGKNPLIPPWADVPGGDFGGSAPGAAPQESSKQDGNNEDSDKNPKGSADKPNYPPLIPWGDAKSNFTRYVKSKHPNSYTARKATRSFVKAQGGAKNASSSSIRGRSTAQNIGGLFSGLAREGSKLVYKEFNFQKCIGKKASELLDIFVDLVIEDGGNLEDAIARKATVETFNKIFEVLDVKEKGLEALQNMTVEDVKLVFQTYLGEYISTSMLQKVGQILEKVPESEARQKEKWIRTYITTKISIDIKDVDISSMDWKGKEGKDFVSRIFVEAYKLIE